MLTTDLSLRVDPIYERITRRWLEHPEELADEFAKAWYKLIHRDMGPVARYLGPLVPKEVMLWQDPIPAVTHELVGADDIAALKGQILSSGLTVSQLVSTAWAAASSFRGSDKRGGANGGRIRLQPQAGWEVNEPDELAQVVRTLEGIQKAFNSSGSSGKAKVSFADLVVLGGAAAIEKRCEGGRARHHGALQPGPRGCFAGTDRCGVFRRARAEGGRLPQLPRKGHPVAGRVHAARQGEPADAAALRR